MTQPQRLVIRDRRRARHTDRRRRANSLFRTNLRLESLEGRRLLAGAAMEDLDLGSQTAAASEEALASGQVQSASQGTYPATPALMSESMEKVSKTAAKGGGRKTFFVKDVSVDEGDSGQSVATLHVTRTGDTSGPASVVYETQDGTATVANGDYQAVPQTLLSFAAGVQVIPVEVAINGDTDIEPDESFSVILSNPSGARVRDNVAEVTIDDDDTPAPLVDEIYVDGFDYRTRPRGGNFNDYQFYGVVRHDGNDNSTPDTSDPPAVGVDLIVRVTNANTGELFQNLPARTDETGNFRTRFYKGLTEPADYLAEITIVQLEGAEWDPEPDDLLEAAFDHDGDGIPSFIVTVPQTAAGLKPLLLTETTGLPADHDVAVTGFPMLLDIQSLTDRHLTRQRTDSSQPNFEPLPSPGAGQGELESNLLELLAADLVASAELSSW